MHRRRFAPLPVGHLRFCVVCRTFKPDAVPRSCDRLTIKSALCNPCAARVGFPVEVK